MTEQQTSDIVAWDRDPLISELQRTNDIVSEAIAALSSIDQSMSQITDNIDTSHIEALRMLGQMRVMSRALSDLAKCMKGICHKL